MRARGTGPDFLNVGGWSPNISATSTLKLYAYKSYIIGIFEGWQRGALPLLNLFLPPYDTIQENREHSE